MGNDNGFAEFANFRDKDIPPTLPLNPELIGPDHRVDFGAFTLTYELDSASVIKITRLIGLDRKTNIWRPQRPDIEPFLAKKAGSDSLNFEAALLAAEKYAHDREQIYSLLQSVLGPHLPKLKGQAVVDSPRLIIEKLIAERRGELKKIDLSQVPNSEISVMEIWEKVDSRQSFNGLDIDKLSELFQNNHFLERMFDFAAGAAKLFHENGVMLDICDGRGIRGVTRNQDSVLDAMESNRFRFNLQNPEQMEHYMKLKKMGDASIFPANSCWSDREVVLFDTFPVDRVPKVDVDLISRAVSANDFSQIDSLSDNSGGGAVIHTARYLFLLKEMGAKI